MLNRALPSRRAKGLFALGTLPVTLVALAGYAGPVVAGDNPVIMEWFECKWTDMERRVPDFFMAGYGGVWVPPPSMASSGSAGYDVWDRFNLGSPSSQTAYGTEDYFSAVVDELHQANTLVYVDTVLNHCSSRQTSASFQAAGGYPGFWMAPANPPVNKLPTSAWGDFHAGTSSGYYQSQDPNAALYNLTSGDLVSLIDIAQESNNQFIRQPVDASDSRNIPAGTTYNKPNANNYRFYPDKQLAPVTVVNPGTSRNPGTNTFTFYPFNTTDNTAGDPYPDNTTGLLMRYVQFMMDVHHVDGFRFDAIKHVPTWFWDIYIDAEMYHRRTAPDGSKVTPYSFGEDVDSNYNIYTQYIRKDSFGNRDCLDLNGAGAIRDLINAGGFGNWQNVLNAHLDTADDNDNNGSIGVNHIFSQDNGSAGDGSSAPPTPTLKQMGYYAHAYLLMRPGVAEVYHNARGISRSGGFWPRQGVPTALGVDPATNIADSTIPSLVQLHNWYARDGWNVLNYTDSVNQSLDDPIIFERRTSLGNNQWSGNVIVAADDSYSTGYDERYVQTSFPAGTRLLEMTGNASNATVDPSGNIFDVITVDSLGKIDIRVPHNVTGSTEHDKGFVVYAPAVPSGALTISNISGSLPADPSNAPSQRRRMNAIPIVSADSFDITLATTNGDPGAGNNNNADDNAVFTIDQGFKDYNGNGVVDITSGSAVAAGYEQFVTQHQPLAGTTNPNGLYKQTIDATKLSEGYHYISVLAFRKRNTGEAPLFREFRQVIYVDRTGPAAHFANPTTYTEQSSAQFWGHADDRTATKMYMFVDMPDGGDPLSSTYSNGLNTATRNDRYDWFRTFSGLTHGWHTVWLTAFEESGKGAAYSVNVFVNLCNADFNQDGFLDFFDFTDFVTCFEGGDCPPGRSADYNGDGFADFFDFSDFISDFENGC